MNGQGRLPSRDWIVDSERNEMAQAMRAKSLLQLNHGTVTVSLFAMACNRFYGGVDL